MKWILLLILMLICSIGYGQTVRVDDATRNPSGLVKALLDNACVEVSNTAISSQQSVAYFNNNGGNFPISEGVIIRSGQAKLTEGKYSGKDLSSEVNKSGDDDLEEINSASGQSPLITDVAFLEFDFVPLSSNFNFNFLFASNEYGEWQCVSSDVFAFLLTDLSTGETSNLAVIPETDTPVSVRTIKDNSFNASCEADNPGLFSSYQVQNPSASTINMRGYTRVMNASADIIPGRSYRIRLVIGDSNDANFDSAIFLEAGSFSANVDLGEDKDFCQGDAYTISTGLDADLYAHSWTYNGRLIAEESTNALTVKKSGTYGVRVTKNGTSCLVTDEIVFADLSVNSPKDLAVCYDDAGRYFYDLTANNEKALGLDDEAYNLLYYTSYTRVSSNLPIPADQLKEFSSSGNQKILIKVFNRQTGNFCDATYGFQLLVNDAVAAHEPQPLHACLIPGSKVPVDLTILRHELLGVQDAARYSVSYFELLQNAQDNIHSIANPTAYLVPANVQVKTLWARVQDTSMPGCYATVSFEVVLNDPPPVDDLEDVVECVEYILPEIIYGNYFTRSGGMGTALFAGDVITETSTIYIFNGPDKKGCTNETSFKVTIIEDYTIGEKYCGQFSVPDPPEGTFYTHPGGPEGPGTELPTGTVLTSNQVIYYYAEVEGEFCREEAFNIFIVPLPPVDQPNDVITCGSYTLPVLQNGNYFAETGGKGRLLHAGEVIAASQDLYVYNKDSNCSNEHPFRITVTPNFKDIVACGSFELPVPEVGTYFTQASGQGEEIRPGSIITSSQTIYYFAETGAASNCTDKLSFEVTILPVPEVDRLENVLICETEVFKLPEITNGEYFTETGRMGERLFPGDIIGESTTIFINKFENECTNESSFTVEIRPLPTVENFTDIYTCAAYKLPVLRHGRYFTGPGASGRELHGGDIVSTTQTLYVYNKWEDLPKCYGENAFTVYVEGIDVGQFEDVSVCDSYTLPKLSKGNYFTESGGKGKLLHAGQKITESQRIYVYSSNGTRFICTDEDSFLISISYTPKIASSTSVESCGSYTLPLLSQEEYDVRYYRSPGGEDEISGNERTISTPGNYTVYILAQAKNNSECAKEGKINITIYPLLDLQIEGGTICRDPETGQVETEAMLSSGLNPREFEVNWYFANELVHTGPDYSAREAGIYTIETVKLKPEKGASCNYNPTNVRVEESGRAVISARVSEPFEDVAVVTVSVDKGFGEYEYQLNNGGFQTGNEFYDVASGTHTISVRGIYGSCGQTVTTIEVLKFPNYFTPNGDGYNDTWSIPDLKNRPDTRIHIFDRYGKLLKVFSPTENWDGLFHGKEMPSDDYWFRVTFEHEGTAREFKSHFTLRRS